MESGRGKHLIKNSSSHSFLALTIKRRMKKQPGLKSSCLYISAFQDSSDRGCKNLYENMFEKEPKNPKYSVKFAMSLLASLAGGLAMRSITQKVSIFQKGEVDS